MKKLYEVEVTHTVYVVADSESEAETVALRGIADIDDTPRVYPNEVTESTPVSLGWRDSVPFGSDEQRTVGQILDDISQKS